MESLSAISAMMETARDLTVEAAQAANASRGLRSGSSTRDIPFVKLKGLLDSRSDRDILDGLRKVVSMIYRSKPCLPYFSSVVKNVANPNIEVKKLVYIYLLHYAESDPDLALLSVNAIQKSLTDQNPQVRAMALRTMSGMRVPVISQIVSLAIKRGVGDMSPHVRKAAALALPKCYRLDPNTLPQLVDYLSTLLGDKQYSVVGSAVSAFLEICPERIDLVHKHYRALAGKLVDMDEWGQLATLRLLLHYSRQCFPRKTQRSKVAGKRGFYEDDQDPEGLDTGEDVLVLDPDLELFLRACKLLLHSRSSAVILEVVSCFHYLGTPEFLKEAVGPLVALLRNPSDIQQVALINIVSVALTSPALFVPYASHFLVHSLDPPHVWRLKLEIMTILFSHCGLHLKSIILNELEHFCHSTDIELVRESVRAIGRCAQSDTSTAARCFKVLLRQVTGPDNTLVSEALTVIRHLIQQEPGSHKKTVIRLAKNLDLTVSPEARATIIWLVGEFAGIDPENNIAPDVLRILAKGFADESEPAKQQIVLLAAKVYLHHLQNQHTPQHSPKTATDDDHGQQSTPDPALAEISKDHPIDILWRYILLLARYDTSYDLRDRARLFKALLSDPLSTQLASLLLLAPKPVPHTPSPSESRKGLLLGSSKIVFGTAEAGRNGLPGYHELPEWVEAGREPDPRLRDEVGEKTEYVSEQKRTPLVPASARLDETVREQGLQKKVEGESGKGKTLDDWLAESGEGETESETETESSEEEEEEEEESGKEDGSTEESEESVLERRHLVK